MGTAHLKWDGLWLTLSKPSGLIYLKPLERKRDGEHRDRNATANIRSKRFLAGECPGRVR
jgi:hypothetical protein